MVLVGIGQERGEPPAAGGLR
ncbi:MAG: hypothetical protein B193_3264, partial [Solidesulfovibrio magneticus str. Maddingley MBC34]